MSAASGVVQHALFANRAGTAKLALRANTAKLALRANTAKLALKANTAKGDARATSAQSANFASTASMLDGVQVSASPVPGDLVPLNQAGLLPVGVEPAFGARVFSDQPEPAAVALSPLVTTP